MNKSAFDQQLRRKLKRLPREDVEKYVEYYNEMIDDRIEEGRSEEEAVEAIGPVDRIVSEILTEVPMARLIRERVTPRRALTAVEIVLLILGAPVWLPLLIAAAAVVLALYVVLLAVALSFYAAVLALAGAAVLSAVSLIPAFVSGGAATGLLLLGGVLVCAGGGILLFFVSNCIARAMVISARKIWLGLKLCFLGRERHA